jgi:hypothetical protein
MIPKFIIADATPLIVLSLLGRDGLDLMLATGAELVVTDMVVEDILEEPRAGGDKSHERRADIAAWLSENKAVGRITEMPTGIGRLYRTAHANWRAMGSPPDSRPDRAGLGEDSIFGILAALTEQAGPDHTTFVIMDDRRGRNVVMGLAASGVANLELMGTAAYLWLLSRDYGIDVAANAWLSISEVADERLDHGVEGDPVLFRR